VRRRHIRGPRVAWSAGVALLLTALAWTIVVYQQQAAFCARLRLHAPAVLPPGPRPAFDPEVVDLIALGIEGVLLAALVVLAVRAVVRPRLQRVVP
jgi:hypothetical protein